MIRPDRLAFTLTFLLFLTNATASMAPLFHGVQNCPAPGIAHLAVPADFNGDSVPDLAFWEATSSTMYIYLADGNGLFLEGDHILLPGSLRSGATGDFDGDGNEDLAITYDGGGNFLLLLYHGSGDGNFEADPVPRYAGSWPGQMVVADVQSDGDLDLALGDWASSNVLVYLNDGSGLLEAPSTYPAGPNPISPAFGDVDEDGLPDLAVAGGYWAGDPGDPPVGQVALLLGRPNGTFAPAGHLFQDCVRRFVSIGDLDLDGHDDLVVCNGPGRSHEVEIGYGHGDGTFDEPQVIELDHTTNGADIADLDLDGRLDLLVAGDGGVSIIAGDGNRGFQTVAGLAHGHDCQRVAAIDTDGNGRMDFLLDHDGGVSIYLQWQDGSYREAPAQPGVALGMASGDLNLDGFTDLLCLGDSLDVYLNPGDGTLGNPLVTELTTERGYALDVGDVDGDGHLDAVGAGVNHIFVARGDGQGGFTTVDWYAAASGLPPETVVLADFNGDQNPDLAVGYRSDFGYIFLNTGEGGFQLTGEVTCGDIVVHLAAGDVDEDGVVDLVATCMNEDAVRVLLGRGDGSFTEMPVRELTGGPRSPLLLHMDNDNHLDLALVMIYSDDVVILPGQGDGTFGDPVREPAAHHPKWLAAGDLDLDGDQDLVCPGEYSRDLSIVTGDGQGGLGRRMNQATHSEPNVMELFDLDRNGYPDVVCGNDARDFYLDVPHLSVHLNVLNRGFLSTGPGPGPNNAPLVRLFDLGNPRVLLEEWHAYGATGYGVNVALGRLDDEPGVEVLTGPGPGRIYGPHVRAFHPDGSPIDGISFLAYGTNRYGVNVACGDLDADGFDEIVTGAGPGAVFGPHVRGWNWDGQGSSEPIPGLSWFAYGTPRWGVNVCCGDLDGDGHDEIITGAGPGAVYGPHVRGWDADSGTAQGIPGVSFLAYGTNKYGVNVACGDLDGDGFAEIVTGAGPGTVFAPHVRGWNWDGDGTIEPIHGIDFIAYNSARWGVYVSCGDLDGDGIDEILTGRGPGPNFHSRVRGWNYDGETVTAMTTLDFTAYDPGHTLYGVKVAAP